jgi:hypothetical protein
MSFFYDKSKILNFITNFFTISGILFTFVYAANSNLLEERFKAVFFTLYHEVSYQKKEIAFKLMFDEKVLLYGDKVIDKAAYQDYIQS